MRIGFLFNHDAVHQVRHTAPVAAEAARLADAEVVALCSTRAQEEQVREVVGEESAVCFERLRPGPFAARLDFALRHLGPYRRFAVLWANRRMLDDFDAIVVPETTSLVLRRMGVSRPRLVWIPHGAGDRSIGFGSLAQGFDEVLVAGPKTRRRMIQTAGVDPARCHIVGYPKFDSVDPREALPDHFGNGRSTVLYNPHFDPRLSSYYDMGEAVLDWFAGQQDFNLIFAPHVMLFRRRVHASTEHRQVRWRRTLADRFAGAANILIDTGSVRSTDMTYTRSADIYIGDASSQIYEWIARPRPAIFLNPNDLPWRGDPDFAHWSLGPVVTDIAGLEGALAQASDWPPDFLAAQRAAFADTFSIEAEPASHRAAEAIAALVTSEKADNRPANP